ncbi:hypothetical protein V5J35_003040 [Endozoicomonas sp. NE40]|uniref:Uncharacterized protein n=1 Tax=Endozoicomonas lisbonensis TaxID=3120522 RepID=A0ABV2SJC8_9GAMM
MRNLIGIIRSKRSLHLNTTIVVLNMKNFRICYLLNVARVLIARGVNYAFAKKTQTSLITLKT